MDIQIENLRAKMRGEKLNCHQESLALDEFEKLISHIEALTEQLLQYNVNDCFFLLSEKTPDNSGEYEVITNRGRVIKIKYKLFEDNGIWECEYGKHEINESVVAWRFLK